MRICKKTVVSDEIYDALVTHYPTLALFAQDFIALENMQEPDTRVLNLIEELKRRGAHIYVLSNIGEKTLANLMAKFPDVFVLFDGVYMPQKSLQYCQKPHPCFYEKFLAFLNDHNDRRKYILFIDDKEENIKAAELCGISGLLFTCANTLKSQLENLGIL